MPSPRRFPRNVLVCLAFAAVLAATHTWWLAALGNALVNDEGSQPAEIAVVLAGDLSCARIVHAAELVKKGIVPHVLVSGPSGMFGHYESELSIAYAVSLGYPAAWFTGLPMDALSTDSEATFILRELQRRGIHRFLLVTSNFHTARAARIYRAAIRKQGGPEFRASAAPYADFDPNTWWRHRQGRKVFLIEGLKNIATAVGM